MGESLTISVVIPMLDAERTLGRCLDALDGQDLSAGNFEVIVVDNGSTDRSAEIARRHPRVRLLVEPRRGPYNARNTGIAASRGERIAFLDPDCEPARDWLREAVAALDEPGVDVACGLRRPAGTSSLLAAIGAYEAVKDERVIGGDDPELVYGYTSNMVVRASVFAEVGRFVDLVRGADTLFIREIARRRGCVAIRFRRSMVVRHLELDSLAVYYRKVYLYAFHRVRNNAILASRPLDAGERLAVYREAVRRAGLSSPRAAGLLAALAIGSLVWRAGTIRGCLAGIEPAGSRGPTGRPVAEVASSATGPARRE